MPRRGTAAVLVASALLCVAASQRRGDACDDYEKVALRPRRADAGSGDWLAAEDEAFASSGVCAAQNRSRVQTCRSDDTVTKLLALKGSECFCDGECSRYGDCCLDATDVRERRYDVRGWGCREVRGEMFSVPIYVWQKCPENWLDERVRTLCEVQDSDSRNRTISHLQDVPVKSEATGLFYRNVFCALCNGEVRLARWNVTLRCPGVPDSAVESELDFSGSAYDARTQNFRNVLYRGQTRTNCRMQVRDFRYRELVGVHHARLCKPFVDTCGRPSDEEISLRCRSYASFVYSNGYPSGKRTVYKNFHCALCNGVDARKITCDDPWSPFEFSETPKGVSLSFLFDFNFAGGDNQIGSYHPCRLADGLVWDRVLKKCVGFTCGANFRYEGGKCVPRAEPEPKEALNSSCYKSVLSGDSFTLYRNRSAYVNRTGALLPPEQYEILERRGGEVTSIGVCVEEGSHLLHLSQVHYWVAEVTLGLSVICLILHLTVYGLFGELRNCPGKVLMSLSACLIVGHVFLLAGKFARDRHWACYVCGVVAHFGYMSSFLWMNVMAFDIYRTFSVTVRSRGAKTRTFAKYSAYCWTCSAFVSASSVIYDNVARPDDAFRPKYGDPICWFNQRKGLVVFFVLPICVLLLKNAAFFAATALSIRKISREAKMAKNFSDRERFLLYVKLTVVFGLTWLLGVLAGAFRGYPFLWYLFVLCNGLQGAFIFAAFTLKRKILKMLRVRFGAPSRSYRMGRQSALRRALYSSLSNLTTVTSQLTSLSEDRDILRAVRKIDTGL